MQHPMKRRLGFKPSLREQQTAHVKAMRFYAGAAPEEKRIAAEAYADTLEAQIKPKRERAAPRDLEGPVVKAISELLAVHPRVIWAARFNSGMASYEAKTGKYAPVWFHKFLRTLWAKKMRMPDFFGLAIIDLSVMSGFGLVTNAWHPFAIEAKAPGWKKPRDDRELEQEAFLDMIRQAGGFGIFATSVDDVAKALDPGYFK